MILYVLEKEFLRVLCVLFVKEEKDDSVNGRVFFFLDVVGFICSL